MTGNESAHFKHVLNDGLGDNFKGIAAGEEAKSSLAVSTCIFKHPRYVYRPGSLLRVVAFRVAGRLDVGSPGL